MSESTWLDPWLRIAGLALVGIGLLVLVWAVRGDRARGRRRCPRCWYDFAGVIGLVCPECGKHASSEKRLHRTRRRWRLGAMALGVVVMGAGAAMWPALRGGSWTTSVPGWLLVRVAPLKCAYLGSSKDPLDREVDLRVKSDRLSDSQMHMIIDRYLDAYPAQLRWMVHTRDRWPLGSEVWVEPGTSLSILDYPRTSGISCKLRIHSDGTEAFRDRVGEYEIYRAIGIARDTGPLALDLEIQEGERRLWTGTKTVPSVVGGAIHDVLAPVTSPEIDERMRLFLNPRLVRLPNARVAVIIEDRGVENICGDDVAYGYLVEVLRDDRVVARGEHFHFRIGGGWCGNVPTSDIVLLDWQDAAPASLDDARWTVRIVGDAESALRDFAPYLGTANADPTKYWAGTFTVPVTALANDW